MAANCSQEKQTANSLLTSMQWKQLNENDVSRAQEDRWQELSED